MNRFNADRTTEVIVPLRRGRGIRVLFPVDLDDWELEDVFNVIRGRIDEKRAADEKQLSRN